MDKTTSVYNNKLHTTTRKTPFEAFIGQPKSLIITAASPEDRRARESSLSEDLAKTYRKRRKLIHQSVTIESERTRLRMTNGKNVDIPVLAVGDVCLQHVPVMDRGRSLGVSQIPVLVYRVCENNNYKVMFKDGSVGQRAAHILTLSLERVSPTISQENWERLINMRENSKRPLRTAVKLYYRR